MTPGVAGLSPATYPERAGLVAAGSGTLGSAVVSLGPPPI
jgi:hypothetical protein